MADKQTLTILLYHGVTRAESRGIENHSKKHIPAHEFEEQLDFVKRSCCVLSMDEVAACYAEGGSFPDRAVAITFDDGFRNNFEVARPLLEKYELPATFYLSSGMINTHLMFWVDRLEDCINHSTVKSIEIKLDRNECLPLGSESDKLQSLDTIKHYCKRASKSEKNRVVAEVIAGTGVVPSVDHAENYQMMSWDDVKTMAKCPLFTIGGHSLYHDIMTSHESESALESDIVLSIGLLEYHLGKKIIHYSYPEGQSNHYDHKVLSLLQKHGIRICPSAIHGINTGSESVFDLKRIMVGFKGTPFPFPERAA